jgi:NhaP-type Na+/H+ or K+/H+ antiporter
VICVKQMCTGTFFVLLFVFFRPYASYSPLSLYYSCHKTNWRSQENFKEAMLLRTSGIIGQKSTFASSLFASFLLQNLNFVPVYAEKNVEGA